MMNEESDPINGIGGGQHKDANSLPPWLLAGREEGEQEERGVNDEVDDDDGGAATGNDDAGQRMGTTSSARFNILSTMVGGGSLSLPLAFQKSGNALLGPLLLILVAAITEFCFRVHVGSARMASPVSDNETRPGKDSFETISRIAFGRHANAFSMALVTSMCFFGTVGYAVLLRDMLQPITDLIWGLTDPGPTFHNNLTMLSVCLLVTPLCTLRTLTSLKRFGAASMFSILILGACILYRSVQCNLGMLVTDQHTTWTSFKLFPDKWKDVLDVFPLFVSCYVCHYNLLPVHNEMNRPSAKRVAWWLRSTTWVSTAFYLVIGISGSAYGHCTSTGDVEGNILLDFPEDDPFLLVGRMCLAITITLAFPMLTIPARDILIRSLPTTCCCCVRKGRRRATSREIMTEPSTPSSHAWSDINNTNNTNSSESLQEPLLEVEPDIEDRIAVIDDQEAGDGADGGNVDASFCLRLSAAVVVFWSAAAVASCVSSIDVVWDLLGSSLSILLSYLIPLGSYLVIVRKYEDTGGPHDLTSKSLSKKLAWLLIVTFTPLMFLSTANAVYDTFFNQ